MAQQTAVEWFAKEINNMNVSREATLFINKLKEQAKQMEKEQIMKAFFYAKVNYRKDWADQYYNETYGNEGV